MSNQELALAMINKSIVDSIKSVGKQIKLRDELTTLEDALNSNLDDGVRRLYEFMRRWLLADLQKLQLKEFNHES